MALKSTGLLACHTFVKGGTLYLQQSRTILNPVAVMDKLNSLSKWRNSRDAGDARKQSYLLDFQRWLKKDKTDSYYDDLNKLDMDIADQSGHHLYPGYFTGKAVELTFAVEIRKFVENKSSEGLLVKIEDKLPADKTVVRNI